VKRRKRTERIDVNGLSVRMRVSEFIERVNDVSERSVEMRRAVGVKVGDSTQQGA
jgi:hypothetical protein